METPFGDPGKPKENTPNQVTQNDFLMFDQEQDPAKEEKDSDFLNFQG